MIYGLQRCNELRFVIPLIFFKILIFFIIFWLFFRLKTKGKRSIVYKAKVAALEKLFYMGKSFYPEIIYFIWRT